MRFLLLIRISEQGGPEIDERLMREVGALIEDMKDARVLVDTAGLRPTREGRRLRLSKGRVTATDGPFTETKEVIGGYFMLDTATQDEAADWMRRFLEKHGDAWELEVELRQTEMPVAEA